MVRYSFIAMAGLACALPLNINLGAYSPALVVGDGEIKLSGNGAGVSNLINSLEGAAINAAATGEARAGQPAPVVAAPAVPAPIPSPVQPGAPAATGAVEAAAAADPSLQEQANQISALQGMGKEIAPRIREREEAGTKAKRQLSGFDRALTYAEAALVKGPKIQMGTPAAGVGLIVDNNQVAAARPGTGEVAEGKAKKRQVGAGGKVVRARVTTMYVRSGIPNSLKSSSVNRDVIPGPLPANAKRVALPEILARASSAASSGVESRDELDSVNLNVDGDQGITMTFVETFEEGDDEGVEDVDEDTKKVMLL